MVLSALCNLKSWVGISFLCLKCRAVELISVMCIGTFVLEILMHYKNISIPTLSLIFFFSLSLSLSVLSLKFSSKCHSTCPYIDRFSFGCLRIKSCKTQKCTRISQPLSVRPMGRSASTHSSILLSLHF